VRARYTTRHAGFCPAKRCGDRRLRNGAFLILGSAPWQGEQEWSAESGGAGGENLESLRIFQRIRGQDEPLSALIKGGEALVAPSGSRWPTKTLARHRTGVLGNRFSRARRERIWHSQRRLVGLAFQWLTVGLVRIWRSSLGMTARNSCGWTS